MLGKSRLKYIQSLGHKKHRDQEHRFVAEGPKMALELLSAIPERVEEVFAVAEAVPDLKGAYPDAIVTEITAEELGRMSQLSTPNKVLTLVRQLPQPLVVPRKGGLTLVLDRIQDPGNLGTLIRIADWFGVAAIICSVDTADQYNPKVVQSTMGSIGRVDVFYTDLLPWLQAQPTKDIFAAALHGNDLRQIGKVQSGIILIGNESKGLSDELLALAGNRITIMRSGSAESLNAAVAAGIILSHLVA